MKLEIDEIYVAHDPDGTETISTKSQFETEKKRLAFSVVVEAAAGTNPEDVRTALRLKLGELTQ